MMQLAEHLAESQGVVAACATLGLPRSSLYRARPSANVPDVPDSAEPAVRPAPPRALSQAEQERVCEILNSERFQDQAPREVYAALLDEEQYLCSWRTMYRILDEQAEVSERRNQLRHPAYHKPELLATDPNQVWSWDITKLRGPSKGVYYYLYVIIDIFSRYVVGWMIAEAETAELAEQLIAETCAKQDVQRAQLTIHADNGGPMTAKVVAVLMADLGVAKSHSRPHVSNDNPYSEAQFKTLKYRPDYPDCFGSLVDARSWSRRFSECVNDLETTQGRNLVYGLEVLAAPRDRQSRLALAGAELAAPNVRVFRFIDSVAPRLGAMRAEPHSCDSAQLHRQRDRRSCRSAALHYPPSRWWQCSLRWAKAQVGVRLHQV